MLFKACFCVLEGMSEHKHNTVCVPTLVSLLATDITLPLAVLFFCFFLYFLLLTIKYSINLSNLS